MFLALVVGKMRGRTKEHFMSGVRYSARLLVRKRSLCIGGQGHVQVVFFSAAAAAAVSHNPLKPGTMSSRANKVSVHTHSSHSRYRPTTLLLLLECFWYAINVPSRYTILSGFFTNTYPRKWPKSFIGTKRDMFTIICCKPRKRNKSI